MVRSTSKYLFLLAYSLLLCLGVEGQDHSYSQFSLNAVTYNPAFAGTKGFINIDFIHRNQWLDVPSGSINPVFGTNHPSNFISHSFAIDFNSTLTHKDHYCPLTGGRRITIPYPKYLGFGISVYKDFTKDVGAISTLGLSVLLSGTWPLPNKKGTFSFGIQPGFLQRSIANNDLIYTGQLDPINGIVISPISFNPNPIWRFDFKAGGFYRIENLAIPRAKRPYYIFGFSYDHFLVPLNLSFTGQKYVLQTHFIFHASGKFNINEQHFAFHYVWENQLPFRVINLGLDYVINTKDWDFYGGLGYRHRAILKFDGYSNSAFIFTLGAENLGHSRSGLPIGIFVSYDVNSTKLTHRLTQYSYSPLATYEVSLAFKIPANNKGKSGTTPRY